MARDDRQNTQTCRGAFVRGGGRSCPEWRETRLDYPSFGNRLDLYEPSPWIIHGGRTMLLSTETVGAARRIAYWRELVCETFVALDCSVKTGEYFRGAVAVRDVGGLNLTSVDAEAQTVTRTAKLIARSADDVMLGSLMVRGDGCLLQDGREAWLSRGDWVLKDTTRPYDMKFDAPFTKWVLEVPRLALRQRVGTPEALTAMPISGAKPLGRLVSDFLTSFASLPPETLYPVQERLASQALDLIALALTQHAPAQAHQGAHRTLLGVRMRSFIEQHLHQADLNGTLIAAAFRMSARSVREVFASHGTTPGRYILARRLERARLLLADPDNHWRGISEIGYAAGFADASHFSRSFRSAFGHSPREARELARRKESHERGGGECSGS